MISTSAEVQEAIQDSIEGLMAVSLSDAIWKRDLGLWKGRDEAALKSISTRLGWLDCPKDFLAKAADLKAFGEEVRDAGFTHIAVLGMGGSSLCVEVLRDVFGSAPGFPEMHVLDSTHPDQITTLESKLDLAHTLFVVSSKSGSTLEPNCYHEYFWSRVKEVTGKEPGASFVAITDPGSDLEKVAKEQKFRRAFINPPDIGGRFSVLSYFGMLPAALIGIDISELLKRALAEAESTKSAASTALEFGAQMAALATAGRDKLTIVTSHSLKSFGYWAEQLIAESTGKLGKGILPVEGETLAEGSYGDDRFFVTLRLNDEALDVPQPDGPTTEFVLEDRFDIGAECFRWEFAVATAGWLLDINPFDEPNVAESKANTNNVLAGNVSGKDAATVSMDVGEKEVSEQLHDFLDKNIKPHSYLAIMAYIERTEDSIIQLSMLRDIIEAKYQCAVTTGFGPRFLHSTGQLHKGGPNEGVYLQFTDTPKTDLAIPTKPFSFGKLITAQATGDRQSLLSKSKPLLHIELGGEPITAIGTIASAF
jgi:glucose-6-phosphate isomerase